MEGPTREMDRYLASLHSMSMLLQLGGSPPELDDYAQRAMRVYAEYTLVLAHRRGRAVRRWDDAPWGRRWLLGMLDRPGRNRPTPLHARADGAAVGLGVDIAILMERLGRP